MCKLAVASGETRYDPLFDVFPIVVPPNTPLEENPHQLFSRAWIVKAP